MTVLSLRFVRKIRKRLVEEGPLKSAELNVAETLWLRSVQKDHFSDIILAISNERPNNLQLVSVPDHCLSFYFITPSRGFYRSVGDIEMQG